MSVKMETAARAAAIARLAAQWRDRGSPVRTRARELLADSIWPGPGVEVALDNVVWDLDEARCAEMCDAAGGSPATTLVFLPGNILGPAVQSAFCAAIVGARAILKASSAERGLARAVAEQFASADDLGAPLEIRDFRGGDVGEEASALADSDAIVVFGEDETIAQIRARAGERPVTGYGESYSVAFLSDGSDIGEAADLVARDVCLFDQRGCMSPQTVYVAGDPGRALRFSHALAGAIRANEIPRARFEAGEDALVSDFVRRLSATAMAPTPHGLDTLLLGPQRHGIPEFVVALEPFGQPVCAGFGRIVIVKPAPDARAVAAQLRYYGRSIETVACTPGTSEQERAAFRLTGARRLCALGEMQRPSFGYRPAIGDFCR